jgi:hypothetical protein
LRGMRDDKSARKSVCCVRVRVLGGKGVRWAHGGVRRARREAAEMRRQRGAWRQLLWRGWGGAARVGVRRQRPALGLRRRSARRTAHATPRRCPRRAPRCRRRRPSAPPPRASCAYRASDRACSARAPTPTPTRTHTRRHPRTHPHPRADAPPGRPRALRCATPVCAGACQGTRSSRGATQTCWRTSLFRSKKRSAATSFGARPAAPGAYRRPHADVACTHACVAARAGSGCSRAWRRRS